MLNLNMVTNINNTKNTDEKYYTALAPEFLKLW